MNVKTVVWKLIIFIFTINVFGIHGKIREKRAVISKNAIMWPNGIIPYYIDNNAFNAEELTMLSDAIETWNMETCVNFRLKQDTDTNWVRITGGTNCHSIVGMNELGEQKINLASPDCQFFGTYLHELGHTIGLHHEHVRPGRDEHLKINRENIKHGHEEFYDEVQENKIIDFDLPYDVQSVMHYGSQSFVDAGGDSIINLKNDSLHHLLDEVHNKDISFLDAKVVNLYYKCSGLCQQNVNCPSSGYVDKNCQCHTPTSFESRRCRDKNDEAWCLQKQKLGKCEMNEKYMSVHCRKSCDKCYKHVNMFQKRKKICRNIDTDSKCDGWTSRGECNRNKSYMKINCKKSCGFCQSSSKSEISSRSCSDKYDEERCKRLRSIGECELNKSLLEVNCAKTCNFCKQESIVIEKTCVYGDSSCERQAKNDDTKRMNNSVLCKNLYKDEDCESWANEKECFKNFVFMKTNCIKACGFCPTDETTTNVYPTTRKSFSTKNTTCTNLYDDSTCNKYKKNKECIKNPGSMAIYCAKACGRCQKFSYNISNCKDVKKNCKKWRKENKCSTEDVYMSLNCAKTCNTCYIYNTSYGCRNLDDDVNCERWSKEGNCTRNGKFMMVQCAKSCRRCNTTNYTECEDFHKKELCRIWARLGKCYKSPSFMLDQCAQTCSSCDLRQKNVSNFVCSNIIDEKFCSLLKSEGVCESSRTFMIKNCGKTCGTCQNRNSTSVLNKKCKDKYSNIFCRVFQRKRFCEIKRKLMIKGCAKTCKFCKPYKLSNDSSVKCRNIFNNKICLKWKRDGECKRNRAFMISQCPQSCGFCKISTKKSECKNLLYVKQCERLAKEKQCQKNSFYMLNMCAQTCGDCTLYTKSLNETVKCINVYKNDDCEKWSEVGECMKNPKFMLKSCAKSCGVCSNFKPVCKNNYNDSKCDEWSKTGECSKNPKFMLINCAKSCEECIVLPEMTTLNPNIVTLARNTAFGCENLYRDDSCENWKNVGHCESYPFVMRLQCRKSCGKCQKSLECQNVYNNVACENWAKEGHCTTNIRIMLLLCMKSCGKCSVLNFKIRDSDKITSHDCSNRYGELTCEAWKEIGECERNSVFMAEKCAKSCGTCNEKKTVDRSIRKCRDIYGTKVCSEWVKEGKCSEFMLWVCQKSCHNCTLNLGYRHHRVLRCQNVADNKTCQQWKELGKCESDSSSMTKNCALTCNKCNKYINFSISHKKKKHVAARCYNLAGDFQCSYWTRQNQCLMNPSYMNIYCRKACNKCGRNASICIDKYSVLKCKVWAEKGECNRNKIWMSENCSKSCFVCQDKNVNNTLTSII